LSTIRDPVRSSLRTPGTILFWFLLITISLCHSSNSYLTLDLDFLGPMNAVRPEVNHIQRVSCFFFLPIQSGTTSSNCSRQSFHKFRDSEYLVSRQSLCRSLCPSVRTTKLLPSSCLPLLPVWIELEHWTDPLRRLRRRRGEGRWTQERRRTRRRVRKWNLGNDGARRNGRGRPRSTPT
jgi:hypothetical protein